MPDTFSYAHLKPWARCYSAPCGCSLERRPDNGVALMLCRPHHAAFVRVAKRLVKRAEGNAGKRWMKQRDAGSVCNADCGCHCPCECVASDHGETT